MGREGAQPPRAFPAVAFLEIECEAHQITCDSCHLTSTFYAGGYHGICRWVYLRPISATAWLAGPIYVTCGAQ